MPRIRNKEEYYDAMLLDQAQAPELVPPEPLSPAQKFKKERAARGGEHLKN